MQNEGNVAIFWDFETTRLRAHVSGYELARAIREASDSYGLIKSFRAYLDIINQGPSFASLRRELHSSGVSLIDCPSHLGKDIADKAITADMLMLAMDNSPPYTIILITADRGLSYALAILRLRRYKVVVVCPPGTHESLVVQADDSVDWNTRILGLDGDNAPSSSSSSSPMSGSPPNSPLLEPTSTPTYGSSSRPQNSGVFNNVNGPDAIFVHPTDESTSHKTNDSKRKVRDRTLGHENHHSKTHSVLPPHRGPIPPISKTETVLSEPQPSPSHTSSVKPTLHFQTPAIEPGPSRPRASTVSGASLFPPPPPFPLEMTSESVSIPDRSVTNQQTSDGKNSLSSQTSSSGFSLISQPADPPAPSSSNGGIKSLVLESNDPPAVPIIIASASPGPPDPIVAPTGVLSNAAPVPAIPENSEGAKPPPAPSTVSPAQTPLSLPATSRPAPAANAVPTAPDSPLPKALAATAAASSTTPKTITSSTSAAPGPSRVTTRKPPQKYYYPLIKLLQAYHRGGVRHPRLAIVAGEIIKMNPTLYKTYGLRKWSNYVSLAVKDGIIDVGGDWLRLKAEWLDVVL